MHTKPLTCHLEVATQMWANGTKGQKNSTRSKNSNLYSYKHKGHLGLIRK